MLYDPTLDIPQLSTVERFKQWLDTQPPAKEYTFTSDSNCALAQYYQSYLGPNVKVGHYHFTVNDKRAYSLPRQLDYIAGAGEHTFGAAAKRAETYLNQ